MCDRRPPGKASKSQALKLLMLVNGDQFQIHGNMWTIPLSQRWSPKVVEVQSAVTTEEQWSANNNLQLNPNKCKEFIIDFKRTKYQLDTVMVNSKILRITLSNILQWNFDVSDVIKKANKCKNFFILLKRANVPAHDIICFCLTCIMLVLE